ncbi:hypothetical protein [Streptomyces anandii]|uniref:Uncharacterized protein n=1 Tax=Streptomyces anandii TaxID=285454 RepID=A0ABW6HFK6_9ACTN
MDEPSLLKLWKSPDGSLTLKSHGAFTAQDLRLQYFECTSAGLASKAGAGDWEFAKGRQASEVLIRFSDGCSATLWAGERSGRIILWSTDTDSDQVFIFEGA